MITINLLATNPGAPAPKVWFPPEQRSALIGLGMLLTTAAGVGGWWFMNHRDETAMERRTAAINAELVRLKVEAKLVDETLAKKDELTERLDLIERLRVEKRVPVSLLETVSRSMTDGMWLTEIKQIGAVVQLDGRSMTTTAATDFAKRLQESGLFTHPVEVQTVTEQIDETQVVHFTMKADSAHAARDAVDADKPATKPQTAPDGTTPQPAAEKKTAAQAMPSTPKSALTAMVRSNTGA